MRKKMAGIILASVMLFSTLSGVQAEVDKISWETSENEVAEDEMDAENDESVEENPIDTDKEKDVDIDEDISELPTENGGEDEWEDPEISFEDDADGDTTESGEMELEEIDDELNTEDLFQADEKQIATYAGSSIPVDKVNADYKMRPEYAFTYAFRKGVTQLSSISRYNSGLNAKLHNWFGDGLGYTEAYCQTFYACAIDADSNTDPITAIYSNVGEYQGEIVDLRVTVPKWGAVNKDHVGKDGKKITPCVMFYKNRIAFNTVSVGIVRFKFEFLKHNTDQLIYPKGHVTAVDLDGGQGIRTYDYWGVDHIYLRNGYNYLSVTEGTTSNGNGYREIKSAEGSASLKNSDVQGWCQLDFNGSFTINWLAQDSWKNSKGVQNAFYLSTGQTIGTYEPNPGPEKRVGEENASFDSMNRHEFTETDPPYEITEGQKFDYVIKQRLLPGNYSSFELKDSLDKCLKFCDASVVTELGNDVTQFFKIENESNIIVFTADTSFLQTDEAYNDVTYYFRIQVQAGSNQEIEAHDHHQKSKEFYSIVNTASRTITSDRMQDTQTTNQSWVKGNSLLSDGEIIVTKRIKEADITWAHGNPVFRFQVTGKDQKGISHVYENYVEFEPGNYKVTEEDAVLSCSFKGIQPGRYTISELPTLRYKFESVQANTENVSISGKTGIANIDSQNKTAAVTFRNKKTRFDRYSHIDVIRNIIPISGK